MIRIVYHASTHDGRNALLACIAALSLVLSACGSATAPTATPAPARSSAQTVPVTASEFAFDIAQTTFKAHTPYTFMITNAGAVPHEWVLMEQGAMHEHSAHDMMTSVSAEELTAGAQVSRQLTFDAPGTYEIACRLPGHYEAGMKTTITVEE